MHNLLPKKYPKLYIEIIYLKNIPKLFTYIICINYLPISYALINYIKN